MRRIAFCLASLVAHALGANHFAGIATSNGIGGTSTYTCRTQAQWNTIASDAKDNGFKSIRVVGFDCDALNRASLAATANGLTILAGIYYSGSVASNSAAISNDMHIFHTAYSKYGASRYVGLTVGNEASDSASNIAAKVNDVKKYLRSVGVATPVSTVHSWTTIRDNPILCGGDFVAANAHAFYDGLVRADQTGDFVFKTAVPALKKACPGKKVMITESGWPSRGTSNKAAIPTISNEILALLSLNCACRDDTSVAVYAFEYDDQNWKQNDNERSFGLFGKLAVNQDILSAC
ncbi:glycoside hydrolase superfamily [Crucibulum laeve]|uniref:glucan endo-1,3-beta-D-glucosidase n=1 Tax=Crucibulum laeve TaxID=68775 RepID=A0A5C3LU59_9AGAR|nr:glycoside hydrolase superfamily [Crucibulum laeve]